ncbi:MAG: TonB-dependent receptor, partial [Acidobacteriia bacterium]|nr:TonB-dependent receptor [Terriglobia bacterium]
KCLLFVAVVCLFVGVSLPARAQVSGATLSGLVTDAQGGVVAGAKIAIKNLGTNNVVETVTNSSGLYTAPNLNPSDYEVSVGAAGFKTAVSKITLTVGAKQDLNVELTVGDVSQTVEISTVAPQIELTSSTISDQVTSTTMRELPLNGRDWASLATLQPSVVESRTHLDVTHVGGGGGRGFGDQLSIGGGRPTQNSYRLDGAIVNDYSNAGPGSVLGKNLGVDAIQEFTVLTSNYSAEYGFTSGGVINAITKSGTNSFHGTAFDFLRNDKLDATDFFANAGGLGKNPLKQNQFGAAGGWRVLKDRAFLFGDYEGVRLSSGIPITGNNTISDAVRNGTVTNLSSCTGVAPPCTLSTVTIASIDPTIQKYLALFPHPSGPAINANAAHAPFLGHRGAGENFFTTRGDYKFSDNDSIFATYLRDTSDFNTPLTFNNVQQGFTSYRQAVVVEETHVFSSSFTNTVRGGLDRTSNNGGNSPIANNPAAEDPSLAQLPGFFSSQIALTNTNVTTLPGGKNYGASIQDFWGQIRQLYDDAFYAHGNHGFKFGFSVLAQQVDGYTPLAGGNGSATYSARGFYNSLDGSQKVTAAEAPCLKPGKVVGDTNGNDYDASCGALVNFLTNQPLSATRTVDLSFVTKHYLRDKIFGVYFQDDWRIRPSLTLNMGLRYEMSTIPTEKYGKVADIPTPTTPLPCNAPPLCATTAPESVLSHSFFTHNPTLKNFEPRLGFAWDPFHNGKTSVRGGFGIFDALPLPYELILNNNSSAPWRQTYAPLGPTGGGIQSSPPSIAAGTAANAQGEWPYVIPSLTSAHSLNPLSRSFMYVEPTPKRNYVYQYNLNIQRQITPSLSLLVGYSGSRALHNPFQADSINTVVPTKDPTSGAYYWPKNYTLLQPTTSPVVVGNPSAGVYGDATHPCPPPTGPVPQNCFLLNTTTASGMFNTDWQARSWYNAMQVKLDKRLSHGFQIQAAYTWSKSIDDSSGSTAGDTFQLDIVSEPWYDMSLNKGLSDFDVRHNFVLNGLWNVPTPKAMGAFGEKALGGWQLGAIMTIASGVPESASLTAFNNAVDLAGEIITTNQPPNVNSGCSPQGLVAPNYRHTLIYLKVSCLGLVPQTAANAAFCDTSRTPGNTCANIRGNLGRDTIIGPGLFDIDFSVFKNNYIRRISETFNVQFRAEMFNAFNHANFAPSSNLNPFSDANGSLDPTFGQLTAVQVPNRQIQLALKMIW